MKVKHDELKVRLADTLAEITTYSVTTEESVDIDHDSYPEWLGECPPLPAGKTNSVRKIDILVEVPSCYIGYAIEVKTSKQDAKTNLSGQLYDMGKANNVPVLATTPDIAYDNYIQEKLSTYNSKLILYTENGFQGISDTFGELA